VYKERVSKGGGEGLEGGGKAESVCVVIFYSPHTPALTPRSDIF
jgi:hypothetical protein